MDDLAACYRWCRQLCRQSGSNFYASFGLLDKPRRNAMFALYAFARISDDLSDAEGQTQEETRQLLGDWRAILTDINVRQAVETPHSQRSRDGNTLEKLQEYQPLWPALEDTVQRFKISPQFLQDIVHGVSLDIEHQQPNNLEELEQYCYHVASAVGLACSCIWAAPGSTVPQSAAVRCGYAFQLTNILRDVAEDAQRQRIYLPKNYFSRYGIDPVAWLKGTPSGDWLKMIEEVANLAREHFEAGWTMIGSLTPHSQRMFSLIWRTYRELLEQVTLDKQDLWQRRITLPRGRKVSLAAQHYIPLPLQKASFPLSQPLTTIVGGGLAGISAALDLTEQGLPVRLIESKRRLGGRTGSFVTSDNVAVDYCQHVGMGCCHNLQRLISMLGQTHLWERHEVLHFFSQAGYRRLAALPLLPAPLHLATWLWKWPSLSLTDRISVMRGLLSIRAQRDLPALDDISAMEWLEGHRQSPAAIQHFWATIIVSALGEELERVSLSAVCKVLQDGFLNDRRAFHLLVPQQPLDALFMKGQPRS